MREALLLGARLNCQRYVAEKCWQHRRAWRLFRAEKRGPQDLSNTLWRCHRLMEHLSMKALTGLYHIQNPENGQHWLYIGKASANSLSFFRATSWLGLRQLHTRPIHALVIAGWTHTSCCMSPLSSSSFVPANFEAVLDTLAQSMAEDNCSGMKAGKHPRKARVSSRCQRPRRNHQVECTQRHSQLRLAAQRMFTSSWHRHSTKTSCGCHGFGNHGPRRPQIQSKA